jgi:hypothetical protein
VSNQPLRKKLPVNPSVEHLQKQAKRLVKQSPDLKLSAAQHKLAQEYGFKNWADLVRAIKTPSDRRDTAVLKRFVDAQQLATDGKPAEALAGILWCFDVGIKDAPQLGVGLLTVLVAIAKNHPPAAEALRERRDKIKAVAARSSDEAFERLLFENPQHKIAVQCFQDAQQLAAKGDHAKALEQMLWCFDKGMKGVPALAGVRGSFLLGAIFRLGKSLPPALEALRQRRDTIQSSLKEGKGDGGDWPDLVAINRILGENSRTLTFFDEVKNTGGAVLSSYPIFAQLLEARRYSEAAAARSLEMFHTRFEENKNSMADHPEMPKANHIRVLALISGQQLEALSGAGDLENARLVVAKMLKVDSSPATLSTLRVHAARSGHDDLIPSP